MSGNNGNSSETTRWICSICGAANSNITHTCEKCGESKTSDAKVIRYNAASANGAKDIKQPNISEFKKIYNGRTYYYCTGLFFRVPFVAQKTAITVEDDRLKIRYRSGTGAESFAYVNIDEILSVDINRKVFAGAVIGVICLYIAAIFLLVILVGNHGFSRFLALILFGLQVAGICYCLNYQMKIQTKKGTVSIYEKDKSNIYNLADVLSIMRNYFPNAQSSNVTARPYKALNYSGIQQPQRQITQPPYQAPRPAVPQAPSAPQVQQVTQTQCAVPVSAVDEIRKYKELLDESIITQEEFDAKKKQLMKL